VTTAGKKSVTIPFKLDPSYPAPDAGNQAAQYFKIPDGDKYTEFSICVVSTGTAVLDSINGALVSPLFVNGVESDAANDGLVLPTNYKQLYDANGAVLLGGGDVLTIFVLPTAIPGGIVLGITGISADGNIHVMMDSSPYSIHPSR